MMTPIKDNLSAIQVPGDARDPDIGKKFLMFKASDGTQDVENIIDIPEGNYRILGYVTKDEISFDPNRYIQRLENPDGLYIQNQYFGDYEYENYMGGENFLYPDLSFRSLLQSKGIDLNIVEKVIIIEKI